MHGTGGVRGTVGYTRHFTGDIAETETLDFRAFADIRHKAGQNAHMAGQVPAQAIRLPGDLRKGAFKGVKALQTRSGVRRPAFRFFRNGCGTRFSFARQFPLFIRAGAQGAQGLRKRRGGGGRQCGIGIGAYGIGKQGASVRAGLVEQATDRTRNRRAGRKTGRRGGKGQAGEKDDITAVKHGKQRA
jgi:hypothetical protein